MPRIFISYRRADSPMAAGRIHDRLAAAFGPENIFKDVDDIPPGVDFRTYLAEEIKLTTVMLVVIGPTWVTAADPTGQARLHHPADYVRIEVETGLAKQNCRVVPVLLGNTMMPRPEELPDTLSRLPFLNAVTIRDDPDFNRDVERLIRWLRGENVDFDVRAAIATFYTAYAEARWAQALALLSQIRDSGLAPSVFDIDGYEREIQAAVERETAEHERRERDEKAQREYEIIRMMAEHEAPERIWQRWQVYRQTYPDVDYDPDGMGPSLSQRLADQEAKTRPPQVEPTPSQHRDADQSSAVVPPVAAADQTESRRSNRWLVAGGAAVLMIGAIIAIAWVLLRDQDSDKKEMKRIQTRCKRCWSVPPVFMGAMRIGRRSSGRLTAWRWFWFPPAVL